MNKGIAVCGMGLLGGFGAGKEAALHALRTNNGPNGSVPVHSAEGAKRLPAYLADPAPLEQYLNKRHLRRLNRYSKMALLGACMALDDAGYALPVASDRLGVIVASGYGALTTTFEFLDSMIDDGDALASPLLFSNSVHSSAASHITILLQITGPCLTLSQFEMSGIAALITACQWLDEGGVDAVLVGAVEEVNSVMSYCHDEFFGQSPERMAPEQLDKQTAMMGEGACFLLLRRAGEGERAQARIERAEWTKAGQVLTPPGATLVLGADGHRCCAEHYRGFPEGISFAPRYGSLPSGQLFDVAFSILAAQTGALSGPVQSVKVDKEGNAGEVLLRPCPAACGTPDDGKET